MYGKWLYKEISTEYGACKVEIYRKNYTGVSIEIGALAANSLSIALENLGSITDPIGKSVCSFSIIDTDQVEYDDFFTPDATALKVVVSTRVGSGAYVTRWSGYVTPDFFAENLSYRTPISISARDNIGYLNDVDFDLTATTITVRELIQSAFKRIAEDYPMSLSFVTQKQTAEGILAIDATISTTLLREMSWGEALETILHDLGLQMRWVDNNTIAVLDLSQIPEYYAIQGFNFVDASGYREIVPAWRQLAQEQSYGVRENFYEGQIDQEAKLEYVTTSQISTNILLYQPIALTQWRREGAIYLLNFFNGYNFDVDDNKAESIYITGVGSNATITDVLATKMVYSQRVTQVDKQMKFTFNLNDTLREPRATSYNRGEADSIFYLPYSQQSGLTTAPIPRPYQLKFRFNVFLRAEDGSEYVMREEWVNANTTITEQPFIEFKTKKLEVYNSGVNDAQGNPRVRYTSYDNEEEFSITIGSIPKAGILEFVVYPYTFVDDEYASVRDDATFQRGAKISDITFAIKDTATGIESNTLVDAQHNVKNAVSYSFGEVPIKNGDFLLYAGGLFNPVNLTALKGYQRNADATNYNLLELVGRELIHFNKKNYNRLSGTIRNLNKEPLMFNRLFMREGKKYAPYNYSLNVISNEMNITSMQEVELYETATFNTIDSQITTGGGTVSGGNNTILQYSEEAGNEKRLFELQTATEQEKNDAYVLVDKAGFPEARKVHISELGGFDVSELEQYLERNGYATLKRIWEVDSANAVVRTTYNVVSTQEIISGRRASGASSDVTGGGGISQVTAQMIVDALGYVPYSSQNPSGYITSSALNGYAKTSDIPSLSGYATETWVTNKGYITSAALNGYATQAWVEGKKYLTAIPSEYITETELSNTLGGYQSKITSSNKLAYSLISGTPTLATVATSGKYSDLSGTPSSLPASDVYAWAKAATKPSYTASEVGALPLSGGTMSGDIYLPKELFIRSEGYAIFGISKDNKVLVGLPTYSLALRCYGTPTINDNIIYHAGNFNPADYLPLSGGTINGSLTVSRDAAVPFYIKNTQATNSLNQAILRFVIGANYGAGLLGKSADSNLYRTDVSLSASYKIVDTGNYADTTDTRYLQLSGGTIKGAGAGLLTINRTNGNPLIEYQNNGSFVGYIGVNASGSPIFADSNGSYNIIHSGNIGSQRVDAATRLVRVGSITDANTITFTDYSLRWYSAIANTATNLPSFSGYQNGLLALPLHSSGTTAQIYMTAGNSLYFRGNTGADWKTIAFTDSNVASANKLLTSNGASMVYQTSAGHLYVGDNIYTSGDTHILGNNIRFRYGTSASYGFILDSSGNVGIGTTPDSGYKLDVNGDCKIRASLEVGNSSYGAIAMQRPSANYIWGYNSGGYLAFGVMDRGGYSVATSSLIVKKDAVYCGTDGAITLGISTNRWGTLYSTGVNCSGDILATGEVISTRRATSSDARLKDNINRLLAEDCLAMVRNLQPSSWDWKENGEHSMGFIAQDVEQYMSYAVTRTKDDVLGQRLNLQYDQFFAPVVGAIQCLDVKVNSHEDEIEGLKKRVKYLENKLQEYGYNRY